MFDASEQLANALTTKETEYCSAQVFIGVSRLQRVPELADVQELS